MLTHSLTHSLISLAAVLVCAGVGRSQVLKNSTHDWPNEPVATPDRWMDSKTPGDGRTYLVGTTIVTDTRPTSMPQFSNVTIASPASVQPVVAARQVAVLQVTDAQGAILHQAYFHGETSGQPGNGLSTYGRAISVFPAATAAATRIVICGETFDQTLPAAVTPPNTLWANVWSSGFVAVYDGTCSLLWSYQFYGQDQNANTLITDVAIHVANDQEVVTYCGVSSNGNHINPSNPASTMAPLREFIILTTTVPVGCGDVPAPGNIHVAPSQFVSTGQWDGIVGRLSRPTSGGAVTRVFHSIVGGAHQDGLFGISELDAENFVVVGSTTRAAVGSNEVVPLTNQSCFDGAGGYQPFCFNTALPNWSSFGTVFWFNSAPTSSGGNLLLLASTLIGGDERNTVARDVVWHNGTMWIVGSTDDPSFTSIDGDAFDSGFVGATEGYLVTCTNPNVGFQDATFVKAEPGESGGGAVGVAAWNEFPDHVAVLGWTEIGAGATDLLVATYFKDTAQGSQPLRRIRASSIGGTGHDRPVHTAGMTVGLSTPTWTTFVGPPEGGGIAMDSRARVTVVGSTDSPTGLPTSYPTVPNPVPVNVFARATQTGHTPADTDAVRTALDMVPAGVCRTDLTGSCPSPGWAPGGSYAGNGGASPACALLAFGVVLGVEPELRRPLIDFEGSLLPGSTDAAILLDRPAVGSTLQGSVMKIGFPTFSPVQLSPGLEFWVSGGTSVSQLYFTSGQSLVVPLGTLPSPGPQQFSIQFVSALPNFVCGNAQFTAGASPALIFGY